MRLNLGKLVTVQTGYSFRSRLEATDLGDISVIQMKDLQDDNTVCLDDLVKIDMKDIKNHHLVKRFDLVFRTRGLLTTSAIILDEPDSAVIAAPLIRLRVAKPNRILPEYLNWYINQRDAQIYLTSQAKGTVQKMISKQTIEGLEIALPSVEHQQAIVELATLSAREQTLLYTLADKREQYISTVLMQFAKGE